MAKILGSPGLRRVAFHVLEAEAIFMLLESLRVSHIIAWRKLNGRRNPPDVLSVKDRIDVEGP